MGGGEISLVVAEGSVSAFGPVLAQPATIWRGRQRKIHIATHIPVMLVLIDELGNELGRECDQEGL